jgi:hypothetical protein
MSEYGPSGFCQVNLMAVNPMLALFDVGANDSTYVPTAPCVGKPNT